MKIEKVTKTKNHHPALGPELEIVTNTNYTFTVWAEWLWDIFPKWNSDIDQLVGLEINEDWLEWVYE